MKTKKMIFSMMLILGLLLAACQPPQVETPPAGDDFIYGEEAVVESLEVVLLESFPVQAEATVVGYLPDGCTELVDITAVLEGNTFVLTLETRRPGGDVACTEALVPFEHSVDLDIQGLEAGTYTVIAQDKQSSFTLDVDNTLPSEDDEQEYVFGENVTVEEMSVNIMESFPAQVSVSLSGYLPDGCTELHEITAAREDQTFTIEIVTRRPTGDVACTMAIEPFEENLALDVEGQPAGEYTVRYGDLTQTFTLDVDNG